MAHQSLFFFYKNAAEKVKAARDVALKYMKENHRLKEDIASLRNSFDIRQRERKRKQQAVHAEALSKRDDRLCKLKSLVSEMREALFEQSTELLNAQRRNNRSLRREKKNKDKYWKRAKEWKQKFHDMKLVADESNVRCSELESEVEEWKGIAEAMQHEYEETIHSMQPEMIDKVWVKNVGKKGEQKIVT